MVDIRAEEHRGDLKKLASRLAEIAISNGMKIVSCAEELDLGEYGIAPGSCVDLARINRVFGLDLAAKRDKSQRPHCNCAPAVDMGVYDTCKFNCAYCYATRSEQAVWRNLERYDVEGPELVRG
jgi:sulfatase maturation enzyme AslB (radical SAM superfamily)